MEIRADGTVADWLIENGGPGLNIFGKMPIKDEFLFAIAVEGEGEHSADAPLALLPGEDADPPGGEPDVERGVPCVAAGGVGPWAARVGVAVRARAVGALQRSRLCRPRPRLPHALPQPPPPPRPRLLLRHRPALRRERREPAADGGGGGDAAGEGCRVRVRREALTVRAPDGHWQRPGPCGDDVRVCITGDDGRVCITGDDGRVCITGDDVRVCIT
eukprot:2512299-Rhodomonas_salina.1